VCFLDVAFDNQKRSGVLAAGFGLSEIANAD